MYKVSYLSGGNTSVANVLSQTIDTINNSGGIIVHMLQSQSSSTEGFVVISITILWRTQ